MFVVSLSSTRHKNTTRYDSNNNWSTKTRLFSHRSFSHPSLIAATLKARNNNIIYDLLFWPFVYTLSSILAAESAQLKTQPFRYQHFGWHRKPDSSILTLLTQPRPGKTEMETKNLSFFPICVYGRDLITLTWRDGCARSRFFIIWCSRLPLRPGRLVVGRVRWRGSLTFRPPHKSL